MTMPGRNENTGDYRYAYNGMETDNELKGNGNSYTTEFRQYDPRIGRWMSLDPLMLQFPWMSPYTAFDNNPVFYIDPYGLESKDGKGGGGPAPGAPKDGGSGSSDGGALGNPPGKWFSTVDIRTELIRKGNEEYRDWVKNEVGSKGIDQLGMDLYHAKKQHYLTGLGRGFYGVGGYEGWVPDAIKTQIYEEIEEELVPTLKSIWAMKKSGYSPDSWNPGKKLAFMYWRARAVTTRAQGFGIIRETAVQVAIEWALRFTLKRGGGPGGSLLKSQPLPLGENIALGVREHLDDFAGQVGGSTWKTWGKVDFEIGFHRVVNNSSNKIHFNLDGIDNPWSAISQGAKGYKTGGYTNWELFQIYSNPGIMQRTIFYRNGAIVPSPF